jgi:hypothetical protein
MENMNPPRGGDPQDFWPTQEIGPAAGQPGQGGGPPGPAWPHGQPGYGEPGYGPPGPSQPAYGQAGYRPGAGPYAPPAGPPPPGPRRRGGRALWWGAGLALVALLAGGGAFAAAALSSHATPAPPPGPTGQAAVLNTMLSSASSPASAATVSSIAAGSTPTVAHPCLHRAAALRAAGRPGAARVQLRRCRALLRVRALGGIHGQFTFESKNGPRTLAYERGVIESVSGTGVVVQATDGTTWTWDLTSSTVVRKNAARASTSALSDGERVFVGGPVASGAYDARLIVIRPAAASPAPSSSPSGS